MTFDGDARTLEIEDELAGGGDRLQWSFPLAPGVQVEIEDALATARWPAATLSIEAPDGVAWSVADGWASPSYGVREPTRILRASSGPRASTRFVLRALRA